MTRRLVRALRSGKYAIDFAGFAGPIEFVRPSIAGHEGEVKHSSHGGPCSLLTPTGCSLEHDARPWGCRDLKPGEKKGEIHCTSASRSSKKREVAQWVPYQGTLSAAAQRVKQRVKTSEPALPFPWTLFSEMLGAKFAQAGHPVTTIALGALPAFDRIATVRGASAPVSPELAATILDVFRASLTIAC
jgi:hypothetical protein